MKLLLFLVLTFVFAAPPVAAAKEIDLKINGIGLGSSQAAVLRQFGKPRQTEDGEADECAGGFHRTLRYSDLVIEMLSDDDKRNYTVIAVEVSASKWKVSGIKIGTNAADVRAKFGEPLETGKETNGASWSYVNKGNDGFAGFYFQDGKLVKILWESVLC